MYLEDEKTGKRLNNLKAFRIKAADGSGPTTSPSPSLTSSSLPGLSEVLSEVLRTVSTLRNPYASSVKLTRPPLLSTSADPIASSSDSPRTSEPLSTSATVSPGWSQSPASSPSLYSSTSPLTSPSLTSLAPTTQSPPPWPDHATMDAQYITAIVVGVTACIVIGLNVGWLITRHRRRKQEENKQDGTALTGSDRKTGRGALSYSKPQLDDTGIVELEADLAPGTTGKTGVYELEAVEKPSELRTSVATWLSRRTDKCGSGMAHCKMSPCMQKMSSPVSSGPILLGRNACTCCDSERSVGAV